tara:strand:- start:248 stop:445 length:198 start_codon:yes stop_codon:yes gene_type:complete
MELTSLQKVSVSRFSFLENTMSVSLSFDNHPAQQRTLLLHQELHYLLQLHLHLRVLYEKIYERSS